MRRPFHSMQPSACLSFQSQVLASSVNQHLVSGIGGRKRPGSRAPGGPQAWLLPRRLLGKALPGAAPCPLLQSQSSCPLICPFLGRQSGLLSASGPHDTMPHTSLGTEPAEEGHSRGGKRCAHSHFILRRGGEVEGDGQRGHVWADQLPHTCQSASILARQRRPHVCVLRAHLRAPWPRVVRSRLPPSCRSVILS